MIGCLFDRSDMFLYLCRCDHFFAKKELIFASPFIILLCSFYGFFILLHCAADSFLTLKLRYTRKEDIFFYNQDFWTLSGGETLPLRGGGGHQNYPIITHAWKEKMQKILIVKMYPLHKYGIQSISKIFRYIFYQVQ